MKTWLLSFLLFFSTAKAATVAYVANQDSNSVSIINLETLTVIATVPVASQPFGIAVSCPSDNFFVTSQNTDTVSVINQSSLQPLDGLDYFSANTGTFGIASLPNSFDVLIVTSDTNALAQQGYLAYFSFDTSSNIYIESENSSAVGSDPVAIALASNPNPTAYVTNSGTLFLGNTVSVINLNTQEVLTNIPVGTTPKGIASLSNNQFVYVSNFGSNNVSVINTSTNSVVATITVGTNPFGVATSAIAPYVVNNGSNNVSVLDIINNVVIATLTVGTNPTGIAITPDETIALVTNSGSNDVSVINISNLNNPTIVATIPVGSNPQGVAIATLLDTVTADTDKDHYFTQTDMFNRINWAPPDTKPTSYEIYGNGSLLAKLPGDATEHIDHNKCNGETTTYVIVARKGSQIIATGSVTATCP